MPKMRDHKPAPSVTADARREQRAELLLSMLRLQAALDEIQFGCDVLSEPEALAAFAQAGQHARAVLAIVDSAIALAASTGRESLVRLDDHRMRGRC